jgi:hypothetical protein
LIDLEVVGFIGISHSYKGRTPTIPCHSPEEHRWQSQHGLAVHFRKKERKEKVQLIHHNGRAALVLAYIAGAILPEREKR